MLRWRRKANEFATSRLETQTEEPAVSRNAVPCDQPLVQRKDIIGHFGDGFCGSNDPTNSVKALKEVVFLRIGFNPTRSTSPCYNTIHACNIQPDTNNTYTEMNLSTVRQNPIQRTVSSVHMCVHRTVHNCCTQYCTEQT